jgi:putative transposase
VATILSLYAPGFKRFPPSGSTRGGSGRRRRGARADVELTAQIQVVQRESRGTYGAPRIHADLAAQGVQVGRKRVARLMRTVGLQGVTAGRSVRRCVTRWHGRGRTSSIASSPGQIGCGSRTSPTAPPGPHRPRPGRPRYGARAAPADRGDSSLGPRLPVHIARLRPSVCRETGVRPSMGSVGDAYDNAMYESFFATLECEWLARHRFRTQPPVSPCSTSSRAGTIRAAPIRARLPVAHDLQALPRVRRSHSDPRVDDRPGGRYPRIPLGAGAVTISKAVHPPPSRGNSSAAVRDVRIVGTPSVPRQVLVRVTTEHLKRGGHQENHEGNDWTPSCGEAPRLPGGSGRLVNRSSLDHHASGQPRARCRAAGILLRPASRGLSPE